jgi:hypothetical protein
MVGDQVTAMLTICVVEKIQLITKKDIRSHREQSLCAFFADFIISEVTSEVIANKGHFLWNRDIPDHL